MHMWSKPRTQNESMLAGLESMLKEKTKDNIFVNQKEKGFFVTSHCKMLGTCE